jgi:hypothetical protein
MWCNTARAPRAGDRDDAPASAGFAANTCAPSRARGAARRHLWFAALALMLSTQGCAQSAWQTAVTQDTPAAYHRYLRSHPDGGYSEEARERLAFHELMRAPSVEGHKEFLERYPDSILARDLAPILEEQAYASAAAQNTTAGYREFIQFFPDSDRAARALGNAVYLEEQGFGGDPVALDAFAAAHRESDYADESRRTLEALTLRQAEQFDRIGLRIKIQSGVADADRLVQLFTERAKANYQSVGVELIPIAELRSSSEVAAAPSTTITIRHSEDTVQTRIADGSLSKPGMLVTTTVLVESPSGRIWRRQTNFRLPAADVVADESAILSPGAAGYWDDFFVPVVSWPTHGGVRASHKLGRKSIAVDATADRVVVLYEGGDFQVFGLADPVQPELLAEYQRKPSYDSWRDVRILEDSVALFGEDGLEIVRVGDHSLEVDLSYGRGEIGSVASVEPVHGGLLLAGSRGLVLMENHEEPPQRLLRRPTRALAADGDQLFFSDGETLFVSSLDKLQQNSLTGQLGLGVGFGAQRIRSLGSWVAVLGEAAVLLVDVSVPEKPVLISRLGHEEAGHVDDAIAIGGRIFLLGHRGLQLVDPTGKRVVEHISVIPALRMARMGHHLTIISPNSLQVVDSVPFTFSAVAMAPAAPVGDPRQ